MKRILLVSVLLLSGCSWFREPPEQGITTGATVIYSGTKGSEVFSICDKHNLVYLTRTNPQVAVIKDGCNPNVGGPGGPSPAAVGAVSERVNLPALPQPFLIQIVPAPGPEPKAAVGEAEPRAPIVIQVQPVPPPAVECPTPAPTPKVVPKAAPKTAPKKDCP